MTPIVFSGFWFSLTSQMLVAASYWLSQRDGAKSPLRLYSELSILTTDEKRVLTRQWLLQVALDLKIIINERANFVLKQPTNLFHPSLATSVRVCLPMGLPNTRSFLLHLRLCQRKAQLLRVPLVKSFRLKRRHTRTSLRYAEFCKSTFLRILAERICVLNSRRHHCVQL